MADKLVRNPDNGLTERYADNGDGTWSIVVTTTGAAAGDKLVPHPDDAGVVERFADMGDGTFARRVS